MITIYDDCGRVIASAPNRVVAAGRNLVLAHLKDEGPPITHIILGYDSTPTQDTDTWLKAPFFRNAISGFRSLPSQLIVQMKLLSTQATGHPIWELGLVAGSPQIWSSAAKGRSNEAETSAVLFARAVLSAELPRTSDQWITWAIPIHSEF